MILTFIIFVDYAKLIAPVVFTFRQLILHQTCPHMLDISAILDHTLYYTQHSSNHATQQPAGQVHVKFWSWLLLFKYLVFKVALMFHMAQRSVWTTPLFQFHSCHPCFFTSRMCVWKWTSVSITGTYPSYQFKPQIFWIIF